MSVQVSDEDFAHGKRAVEAMKKLCRAQLEPLVRTVVKDHKIRCEPHPSQSFTNGKSVFIATPWVLGETLEHDKSQCGKRDLANNKQMICPACRAVDGALADAFHETAHITEESFEVVSGEDILEAVREVFGPVWDTIDPLTKANLEDNVRRCTKVVQACSLIDNWLGLIANVVEDIYVNRRLMHKRPGTAVQLECHARKMITEGMETQGNVRWQDAPKDAQAFLPAYLIGAGLTDLRATLPEVEHLFDDPVITRLMTSIPGDCGTVERLRISMELLNRYRELGYMPRKSDSVMPPTPKPTPPPEEEPEEGGCVDEMKREPKEAEANDDSDDKSGSDDKSDDEAGDSDDTEDGDSANDEGDDDASEADTESTTEAGDDDDDGAQGDDTDEDGNEGSDDPGEAGDSGDDEAGDDGDDAPGGSTDSDDPGDSQEAGDDDYEAGDSDEDDDTDHEASGKGGDAGDEDEPQGDDDEDDFDAAEDGASTDGDQEAPASMNDDDAQTGTDDDDDPQESDDDAEEPMTDEEIEASEKLAEELIKAFTGHDGEAPQTKTDKDRERALERVFDQSSFDSPSDFCEKFEHVSRQEVIDGWGYTKPKTLEMPEGLISSKLMRLRVVFSQNRKTGLERSLRSGPRLDTSHLHRIPNDDLRIFGRKTVPKKRDWFVVLGLDLSGSTGSNGALHPTKLAGMALGEMLSRLGIAFTLEAHASSSDQNSVRGYDLRHITIKSPDEPWTPECKQALSGLYAFGCNLDGHSMERYRKIAQARRETDKLIVYFTDGAMPMFNRDEELEILQREIKTCRQLGIALTGVGYQTDSPAQHGLETIVYESSTDIPSIVAGLERHLSKPL